MVNYPMEEAIVEIVSASYFIRASNLSQLQLITLLEEMEYYDHLLIFEGVLLWRKLELLIIGAVLLGFQKGFS